MNPSTKREELKKEFDAWVWILRLAPLQPEDYFNFFYSKLTEKESQLSEAKYAINEAIQVMEHYNTGEDFALVSSLRRLKEFDLKQKEG